MLRKDIKVKKKIAFIEGLSEKNISEKVNQIVGEIQHMYKSQIHILEQQISDLIYERDSFKLRCQSQLNESVKFHCGGNDRVGETEYSMTDT